MAMRHPGLIIPAIVAAALSVAPVAAAHEAPRRPGPVVAPARSDGLTGGELAQAGWTRALELPGGVDPLAGGCAPVAPHVVRAVRGPDDNSSCVIARRTRLFVSFGTECSSVEDAAETRAEQLACAVASDEAVESILVQVDGLSAVEIVRPRFEVFSPQGTLMLPEDNGFDTPENDVPAGPATFSAHGWAAVVGHLRPGRHTVTLTIAAFGDTSVRRIDLRVRPGHRTAEAGQARSVRSG
jgi:hypothetical protein